MTSSGFRRGLARQERVKAVSFYTEERESLTKEWSGRAFGSIRQRNRKMEPSCFGRGRYVNAASLAVNAAAVPCAGYC